MDSVTDQKQRSVLGACNAQGASAGLMRRWLAPYCDGKLDGIVVWHAKLGLVPGYLVQKTPKGGSRVVIHDQDWRFVWVRSNTPSWKVPVKRVDTLVNLWRKYWLSLGRSVKFE